MSPATFQLVEGTIWGAGLCRCGCGLPAQVNWRNGHNAAKPATFSVDEHGCWVWQGRIVSGYGQITRDKQKRRAHRWIYERFRGAIPAGMQLDHLCRNRACVNPAHLEPVTNAENVRRGRGTKLTRTQVAAIRAAEGTPRELADRFGVTPSHVTSICRGRVWTAA